jgi:hypothetical protein
LTCAIVPAGAAPFLFPRDGNDDEDDAGTRRKSERKREREREEGGTAGKRGT